eukprot:CAMPEP_0178998168 /NCGR_PEP_ID=MMETSP0795-20121207/9375_1 /TAXON_ID=88552 /ORGANISM="Amoebophrya sp., Strain Ameob2" /LENGTH=523 /DNA_ID=CAMNT_0020690841 /DNA_START=51 /DNA_END=1623 /DNA_ORIENTATION=+
MSSFPRRTTGGLRRFVEDPAAMVPPDVRTRSRSSSPARICSAEGLPIDEVTINGHKFDFWSYKQLEGLSAPVLSRRVAALQQRLADCGFPDQGAPRSRQCDDLTRYIIVKQAHLSCEAHRVSPTGKNIAKMLRRFGCPEAVVVTEAKLPTHAVVPRTFADLEAERASPRAAHAGHIQERHNMEKKSSPPNRPRADSPLRHTEHYTETGAYGERAKDCRQYGHHEDTRFEGGCARVLGAAKRHIEVPDRLRPKARSVDVTQEQTGRYSQIEAADKAGMPISRDPSPRCKRVDFDLHNQSHFNGCALDENRPENLLLTRMNERYAGDVGDRAFGARLSTKAEQRKKYHAPRPSSGVVVNHNHDAEVITAVCHRTGELKTWEVPYEKDFLGGIKKHVPHLADHAHCAGVFETDKEKNEFVAGSGHGRRYIDATLGVTMATDRGGLSAVKQNGDEIEQHSYVRGVVPKTAAALFQTAIGGTSPDWMKAPRCKKRTTPSSCSRESVREATKLKLTTIMIDPSPQVPVL